MASGATVTENDLSVTKTGDSKGGDNCNFYGQNAAVLAKDGATLNIDNATITSDASGANGVFSYGGNGGTNGASGDGTTVNISDSTITTTGSGSGGIMTTGGGVTNAENLTVTTSGQSSAAIRTDRGGGTVNVNKGTYTTNGLGSPSIYSTADITVSNATLTSNLSEGVCIEGKNSITLKNCDMTANNTKTNGNATFNDTIMIYQSMSGDADSGTSSFTMTGGSLTSKNGHTFHVTNTNAVISLEDVDITNSSDNVLLSVCDDGWSGASNIAMLNASNQSLSGDVLVGDDSTLTMTLSDGSIFTGKTSGSITNAKGSTVSTSLGTVNMTIASGSTWVLSGDCEVSSLSGSGNINYNGYTLTVNGKSYSSGSIGSITETNKTDTSAQNSSSSSGSDSSVSATKTVSFKNVSKTFKASALKKTKKTYSIIKASDGGKVTVSKYLTKASTAKKYITISKTGKVTVKKNTPKGTYKIKVKVAAKGNYKTTVKTIKIKIK